jgi:hypothetical protein
MARWYVHSLPMCMCVCTHAQLFFAIRWRRICQDDPLSDILCETVEQTHVTHCNKQHYSTIASSLVRWHELVCCSQVHKFYSLSSWLATWKTTQYISSRGVSLSVCEPAMERDLSTSRYTRLTPFHTHPVVHDEGDALKQNMPTSTPPKKPHESLVMCHARLQ